MGFKLAIFYMPFLIAFILSLLIEPIIRFLMKKVKLKRRTSAIIVFVLVISIIVGLAFWGITTLIQEASNMLTRFK
ncbi:sporulation integral membrane protein YtvI [Clostridium sp. CAG:571]|nr:sporulation integral membrane protein YtvI [Clostridium sp. CAG:571]HJJ07351.1 AI-2E family transporter [Clostridiaceae bacterium]